MTDPGSRSSTNSRSSSREQRLLQRLDIVCDSFEARWLVNDRPDIGDYLGEVPANERAALFLELLQMELEYRREREEPLTQAFYAGKFPDYTAEIDRAFSGDSTHVKMHDEQSTLWARPHFSNPNKVASELESTQTGSRFAGYELVHEIARGGMGVVFKARQTSAKRTVALKMILSGSLASREEIERFHAEAEAAAKLDHPNIVPIFEVGEHNGQHYYSMGYVSGPSLKEHLEVVSLRPREAAEFVRKTALAIDYAHCNGVIHRDLKPANILLDDGGNPRVADFGLSKVMDGRTELTGTGQLLGTPTYMSPEQAMGAKSLIGPVSDVYALGAILYEMLSGCGPFHAENAISTLNQVCTQDPIAPSALNGAVDADIETICLKCLEKDPGDRYPSAGAFAEDLTRYLQGEPISARPFTRSQRLVRWCKRHPAVSGLMGIVIALLISLGPLTGYFAMKSHSRGSVARAEREHASENLQMAQLAVDQMVEQAELLSNVPQTESRRQELLDKAAEFYDRFLQQRPGDEDLRHAASIVHRSVGDLFRLLGRFELSKDAYQSSIDLLSKLSNDYPHEAKHKQQLAESYIWLGVLRNAHGESEALVAINKAIAIQTALAETFPNDSESQYGMAKALYNRGMVQSKTGRLGDAEADYQNAIELLKNSLADGSEANRTEWRRDLARAVNNYGNLLKASNRLDEAKTQLREAIQLLRSESNPDRNAREDLAVYHNNLSNALAAQSELTEAAAENDAAIELLTQLVDDFPRYPDLRSELANTYNSRGALAGRSKDMTEAALYFGRAEEAFSKLLDDFPDHTSYMNRLGAAGGTPPLEVMAAR